ncbi:hypothetical protein P9265_18710 [Schinkia azotoformans]|uniref:phosphoribosyltransferase-like protein n=1 Tax=Schinkia azotoformans TaxID=1454 RepID=UPI002E206C2D|nr:hypothetical protein [Schinkia azotoformans]
MINRKKKQNLSIDIFNKIGNLFEDKGWEISEDFNDFSLFGRFCDLLSYLNSEQQDFIIELTSKYYKVDFEEYIILISKILNTIFKDTNDTENLNTFYVMPLITEKDKFKIKSSTLVAYLFQSPLLKYNGKFSNINFKVRNELTEKEINKINESPKTKLFLVDDFIGTGETALASFDFYVKQGINRNEITIISLVSQEAGYLLLKGNNIDVHVGQLFKRSISDYYQEKELKSKLQLMNSIEDKIRPSEDCKLGYKGSEALVTLVRTPNNTFPIYWLEKKSGHKAPFPRGG